jgi:hypothetical protein
LAPPERVWNLLTDPATYETWADARVDAVDPPGPAQAGQIVQMSSGFLALRGRVRFELERVDESARDLEFRGTFPLGVTLHEHISVRPVDAGSRVQYG